MKEPTFEELGLPHETEPMLVWADIDIGIAPMVAYLNTIPGVRTCASCQGTVERGGQTHAYVFVSWRTEEARAALFDEFDMSEPDDETFKNNWGEARPKPSWKAPTAVPRGGDMQTCWNDEMRRRNIELNAQIAALTQERNMLISRLSSLADPLNETILSGSPGPLFNAGWASAWKSVQSTIASALTKGGE